MTLCHGAPEERGGRGHTWTRHADTLCDFSVYRSLVIFSLLSALAYHIAMGIRHLVMDFGFAEDFRAGQISALAALLVTGFLIFLTSWWIYI